MDRDQLHLGVFVGEDAEDFIRECLADGVDLCKVQNEYPASFQRSKQFSRFRSGNQWFVFDSVASNVHSHIGEVVIHFAVRLLRQLLRRLHIEVFLEADK